MRRALALMVVCAGVAGCGFGASAPHRAANTAAPGATSAASTTSATTSTSTAAALAGAQRTHEYPTPAPPQRVIGGWRSPAQAVQVFATTYINWNASTVSPRLRALAEVSVGQARSAMALAAAQVAHDYELRRGGIANSGAVEAVAPVLGHPDEYAVVTRERTTATASNAYQGLQPAWHVALATVTRV
ncbi:MAG: hypothetical protein WAK93_12615, partial [Solirubrobacteraceae bacterium]